MICPRLKMLFAALLIVLLAADVAALRAAPPAGQVWSVAPAPLLGVPAARQFRTISEAALAARPGDTVLIHSGVYRESVTIAASGTVAHPITFEAAPAAVVVVTGADLLTGWRREPGMENIFSTAWPYSFLNGEPGHAHPEGDEHLLIGRAEQVFVQNYPLHQVLERSRMSRGTFFADLAARRLYVWNADNADISQNGAAVEGSIRSVLWQCRGEYVATRGLCFRYAANAAQQGAAEFDGRGDIVDECTFERTNGRGASFEAPHQRVSRCTFRDNGQMGFGAAAADSLLVRDCLIQNNNTKDFGRWFEAGGEKIVLTRGAVIDRCRVLDNRGVGLWFDIGNEDCEVRNCLIAGNEDAGIFYEISYGLHAHDNVIAGNGLAGTPGSWGGAAGICLSSSPGCVIERNLLVANKEGFNFREQLRTTPRIGARPRAPEGAIWNHDDTVRRNVLAFNRDAQTWGWFDVADERCWPRVQQTNLQQKVGSEPSVPSTADKFTAKDLSVQPANLSLDRLHFVFQNNLYSVTDNEGLFNWGPPWRRHAQYAILAAVRKELSLEQGSVAAPFVFGDYQALDLRVPASSLALKMDCYPHGEIPGVHLQALPQPK